MLDVRIDGGTVVDGSGGEPEVGSVGVRDGVITAVGAVDEPARRVVDATGLVVAPGFIDVHTHYDPQLMWDPAATPSSLHGVTTVLGGNCGFTIAPLVETEAEYLMRMLARVEGMPVAALEAGVDWGWRSFGEWLGRLDGNLSVNAGFLVGHSTLRRLVMGEAAVGEVASAAQVAAMVELLHHSLDEGGLGFSSTRAQAHNDHNGDPVPSRFADDEELLALCAAVGGHDGTSLEFIPTIDAEFSVEVHELMTSMASAAGRTLNWNLLGVRPGAQERAFRETKLAASDHARANGARVVALTLPDVMRMRLNFSTGMLWETLTGWAEIMHLDHRAKLVALADPAVRERLASGAAEVSYRAWVRWDDFTIADVASPSLDDLVGRRIGDLAAERGCGAFDAMVDVALADDLATGFAPAADGDDDETWRARAELWRDDRAVIGGSDAGAHLDMMMTFGCLSGFLAQAVRERGLLSIAEAVRLITAVPADLYGLRNRGRLRAGSAADVCLFDLERVGPGPVAPAHDLPGGAWRLYGEAEGISHTFVNGVEIVRDGTLTGNQPGTTLRSGRDTTTA